MHPSLSQIEPSHADVIEVTTPKSADGNLPGQGTTSADTFSTRYRPVRSKRPRVRHSPVIPAFAVAVRSSGN